MTNDLTPRRQAIVDHLKAKGFDAFSPLPEVAPIPCVWVVPADPYITTEGAAFGGRIAHFQVNFAAAPATNEVAADELDDLLLNLMDALDDLDGYWTGDADKVGTVPINNQAYLAASIAIATEFQRS